MIEGTINNIDFSVPLEPDGVGSHWFRMSDAFCDELTLEAGDSVTLSIRPTKNWIEP